MIYLIFAPLYIRTTTLKYIEHVVVDFWTCERAENKAEAKYKDPIKCVCVCECVCM